MVGNDNTVNKKGGFKNVNNKNNSYKYMFNMWTVGPNMTCKLLDPVLNGPKAKLLFICIVVNNLISTRQWKANLRCKCRENYKFELHELSGCKHICRWTYLEEHTLACHAQWRSNSSQLEVKTPSISNIKTPDPIPHEGKHAVQALFQVAGVYPVEKIVSSWVINQWTGVTLLHYSSLTATYSESYWSAVQIQSKLILH